MATPGVTPSGNAGMQQRMAMQMAAQAKLKGAASWFYWIAALSVVNSLIVMGGGRLRFIFGMGTTEIVDAIAQKAGGAALGLVVSIVIAGTCAVFGVLGNKRMAWAVWLGMVLYVIDGLLLLLVQDWLSAAFHVWALMRIYQAIPAITQLNLLEQTPQAMAATGSPIG